MKQLSKKSSLVRCFCW